jgi:hypothetical protein
MQWLTTHSPDDGPISLHRPFHERSLLLASLDIPHYDVKRVAGVVNHVAETDKVALARREVNVLDTLVLKFGNPREFGCPPQCHSQLVNGGEIGTKRRPVKVCLGPSLQREREKERKKGKHREKGEERAEQG